MVLFSRISLAVFLLVTIVACASSGKTVKVQVGMTKPELIDAIGDADSASAQGSTEVLSYYLCYSNCAALIMENRGRNWYYVRLIDGRVDSYGNNEAFGIKGDFDNSKVITKNSNIKADVSVRGTTDMYAELKKLQELKDSKIITQEEFDAKKKKILAQ